MLLDFKFKNFRSFYDKAELSMIATGKRDYIETLISTKEMNKKILPTCVIYGANASGKTSVILAQKMLKEMIEKGSVKTTDNTSILKNLGISSFIHEKEKYETPIEFDITFLDTIFSEKQEKIRYKCSLQNDYNHLRETKVINEELYINDLYLFKRNKNMVEFNMTSKIFQYYNISKKYIDVLKKLLTMQAHIFERDLSDDKIFISWYSNLNSNLVESIKSWFEKKYLILYDFNEAEYDIKIQLDEKEKGKKLAIEEITTSLLKKCIEAGPQKLVYTSKEESKENEDIKLQLRSIYKIKETDKKGVLLNIPSETSESKGTLKMYKFLLPFVNAIYNGATMVVDELDASIHPELIIGIIQVFKNPEINKKGAQLIFNTHNPIYLNKSIFRRDELYFVNKNKESYESELYSLVDFDEEIRSDVNYMKNYINGKYGAISYCNLNETIEKILNVISIKEENGKEAKETKANI